MERKKVTQTAVFMVVVDDEIPEDVLREKCGDCESNKMTTQIPLLTKKQADIKL